MSDDEHDDDMNDMMILRKKIEERDALLASLMENDPEYSEAVDALNSMATEKKKPLKPKKRRSSGDSAFRFTGYVPVEKRKSARLEKKTPTFSYLDLPNEVNWKRMADNGEEEDYNHLEDVVYEPKRRRISNRPPRVERHIINVEDVTPAMLDNVARKVSEKGRSLEKGTSCHQCRQKTTDTKSCCRSNQCVGVRGQYCGPCMMNRYGEDVAVALLDPNWECFVCRGICNCSFCRAKEGKRPTGILTHVAQKNGYRSVQEFLEGIHKDQGDSEKLLGFSSDLKYAVLENHVKYDLYREYKSKKDEDVSPIKDGIGQIEKTISDDVEDDTPPKNVEKVKKGDAQLKVSASIFGSIRKKRDYLKPKKKNKNKDYSSEDDLKENNDINKSEIPFIREQPDSHVLIERNSTENVKESIKAPLCAKAEDDDERLLIGFTKEGKPVLK